MTGSKVFIDTAPTIYLVEQNPAYFEQVSIYLADAIRSNSALTTSVLTTAEVEIKPRKLGKKELTTKFEKTIQSLFEVYPITWDVAQRFATLRAKYTSLRAIDSLQIACAIHHRCESFVTNDKRLKTIKEIPIILIRNL
ncbi:type II toxin-antitoxin system VapC family toxin [Ohtaekwangia sp.]|uniref:type II toxin-antitoxin system VapC family toxin n=1 Tax=Ohtaekwangia sp. TaxID=2066019 RepID=UPI0039C97D3B